MLNKRCRCVPKALIYLLDTSPCIALSFQIWKSALKHLSYPVKSSLATVFCVLCFSRPINSVYFIESAWLYNCCGMYRGRRWVGLPTSRARAKVRPLTPTDWCPMDSNPGPLGLKSSILHLSHQRCGFASPNCCPSTTRQSFRLSPYNFVPVTL